MVVVVVFVVVWSKLNGLECLVSIPKSNLIIKSPLLIVERECVCARRHARPQLFKRVLHVIDSNALSGISPMGAL